MVERRGAQLHQLPRGLLLVRRIQQLHDVRRRDCGGGGGRGLLNVQRRPVRGLVRIICVHAVWHGALPVVVGVECVR